MIVEDGNLPGDVTRLQQLEASFFAETPAVHIVRHCWHCSCVSTIVGVGWRVMRVPMFQVVFVDVDSNVIRLLL